MNIKQFDLLKEVFDTCRQMVYAQESKVDCEYMENKIVYLKNLIKEYDKYNSE